MKGCFLSAQFASVGGIAVIAAITATAVVVTRDGKEEGGTFVATPGVTFEEVCVE